MPKPAATTTITLDCSGCRADVTLDLDACTASVRVPANGRRGALHVPAHTLHTEIIEDEGPILLWDCPACDYADSHDPAA